MLYSRTKVINYSLGYNITLSIKDEQLSKDNKPVARIVDVFTSAKNST